MAGMVKFITGIGIPASGKSAVLKTFAEKNNYVYINPDDIRKELKVEIPSLDSNAEVYKIVKERIAEGLKNGITVVLDTTLSLKKRREEYTSFARENGAEKVEGIFLDVPIEKAKERNRNRERIVPEADIDRMGKSLSEIPPELVDGFDSLFTLNEEQKLIEVEMKMKEKIVKKEFNEFNKIY